MLSIDPDHINAAYARGACENKRGNFDKAIEDYHMALEKDKERPTSPIRGLSSHKNQSSYRPSFTQGRVETDGSMPPDGYNTYDQPEKEVTTEKRNIQSNFSESPMMVGRDMSGYGNKNMLLSPGGQINNMSNLKLKREDSMTSNATLALAKQHSDGSGFDRSNPIHRLSKASSISSFTTNLQNTPHEETKSHMSSTPATPNYRQNHSPSHPNHYRMLKKEAEGLHSQGYAARKKGDYETAIIFYTRALEVLPTHFKALFNRGFAFDKIGHYDKAIEDYTKAIEIDPQNAFTYYNKGISLDRKGDYDEAIWFFTKAIELEPKKADFYHNRGFAYRKKKDYNLAIEDYTSAISINPTHFKAFYNRAFCWDKLTHLEKAEGDYMNAVQLQPNNISALHHLGTVQEKIGGEKLSLALDNFNKVIELNQEYSPSYNGRGLVWDRFFNFDEAIQDFSTAINLDSKNAVYWHNRACCYRNMGLLEEAINDFDKAVELDTENPIIYSNRGLVKRKQENFVEAIEDYALELNYGPDNNIKALNNRAYCYAKIGQFEQAIDDYASVIDVDSKNIHALHNRGISYERIGQYKAVSCFF